MHQQSENSTCTGINEEDSRDSIHKKFRFSPRFEDCDFNLRTLNQAFAANKSLCTHLNITPAQLLFHKVKLLSNLQNQTFFFPLNPESGVTSTPVTPLGDKVMGGNGVNCIWSLSLPKKRAHL